MTPPSRDSASARRFVFVVLDGVGIGALPDAAAFGDEGSDTLGNLARLLPLRLPHLARLGLGNIASLPGVPPDPNPLALPGRLAERSAGKDTTAGHWEHMGLITTQGFPTYPEGFPPEVMEAFERAIGRGTLGNVPASGTEIIADLGEEHVRTGRPIVYTSADSVFQVAAHVDVIPLEELYDVCRTARRLLTGRHRVGRVIARPFAGEPGHFYRTPDRRDFSLEPTGRTYLDRLVAAGIEVTGIGKIPQIFAGRGITRAVSAKSNEENLQVLGSLLEGETRGLVFTNLVDFDMKWGHRNDPEGFAGGLEAVDRALPELLDRLAPGDRLLLTADHGVDPTTVSTDHSREYVPLLLYPRPAELPQAVYEGWFADTGATALHCLTGETPPGPGRSVLEGRPGRGWRSYAVGRSSAPAASGGAAERSPGSSTGRLSLGPWGDEADAASGAVWELRSRFGAAPEAAVLLGSGLEGAVADLEPEESAAYEALPGWPRPTVAGHPGRLVVGTLGGARLAVLLGRLHPYERGRDGGMAATIVSLARWGVTRLLVTNASGALPGGPAVGSVVRVSSVLDLQSSVLTGEPGRILTPGDERGLEDLAPARYAAVLGPEYETAAEAEALRRLGADIVGMSTAEELREAEHAGLPTGVVSVVTNVAGEVGPGEDEHAEVIRRADRAAALLAGVLEKWLRAAQA